MTAGPAHEIFLTLSDRELSHYRRLLAVADPDGSGIVQAPAGASFLQRSGLPQDSLRGIWAIADAAGEGRLSADAFFAALRLVAHAQAGCEVSASGVGREPDALPEFSGVSGQDRPHGLAGALPPSTDGSLASTTASAFTSVAGSQLPRWKLSERDKRKYARLFVQTDKNGDGFVEAFEARGVCERSGLDDGVLALAWNHADRDRDGRLTFQEFVCLMHIVSCRLRGAEVPSIEHGLPDSFLASIGAVHESARTLASQGKGGSRSPSSASRSSRSVSPSPPARTDDVQVSRSMPAFSLESPSRAAQRRQKQLESPQFGSGSSPWTTASSHSGAAPRFGDERSPRDLEADIEAVSNHFRGVLRADRLVSQQLRSEGDSLEAEVRRVTDEGRELKQLARRERDEGQQMQDVQHQFERQLHEAKQRLASLQEERRELSAAALLRRDREPFAEGLSLLVQAADDEGQILEELQRTNTYLGDAQRAMQEETERLEATLRRISEDVSLETTVLRREEQVTADIRQLWEQSGRHTLSRTAVSAAPWQRPAGWAPASEVGSIFSEPSSWAPSLPVPGRHGVAAPAGNLGAGVQWRDGRIATRPVQRDGV